MPPRLLAAATIAVVFAFGPLAQAQPASAPAAAPAAPATPATPAAPAAATAPAPEAAKSVAKDAVKAVTGDANEGKVSFYSHKFTDRKTASGERFNPKGMTMAHKTLPFGTLVRVTNLKNKRSVVVRVNDRGPPTPYRIGDITSAAAAQLKMHRAGVIDAKLEIVGMERSAKEKVKAETRG